MTTKIQAEFLAAGIISDQTQVSAADADHVLIFDASDNSLKKALVSTVGGGGSSAADDITAGDAAVTISTTSGNITIDNGSSDDDIIFKGTDGGSDITAMTIDMSEGGNVGIGETSPDLKLHVKSSGQIAKLETTASTGDCILTFADAAANKGFVGFGSSSSETFQITNIENGDMKFDTNNTERMRIDSSGNVGIGTTAIPHGGVGAAKLALEGGDQDFTTGPHVQMTTASDDHPLMQILAYSHDNVSINFDAYHNGTAWTSADAGSNFQIYKLSDALNFYYKSGVAAGSAVGTWDNGAYLSATSGYFGVHTGLALSAGADITPSYGTWTGEKSGKIQFHANHCYIQTTGNLYHRSNSGTNTFVADNGGNVTANGNITAYGNASDIKLKENVEVIENPVDKIKQLKGVTFNYKKDGSKSTGLIAQDLEKVLPEAVYTSETIDNDEINGEEPEEFLAIRYGNTVGLLVEAIKEQQEQIETLTAKVKELENK